MSVPRLEGTHGVLRLMGRLLPVAHRRYLRWYRERFGTAAALNAALALIAKRGSAVAVPTPDGGRIWLRPGTADVSVFNEIFVHRAYAVGIADAEYVVDAGAHIGCASLFFSHLFPHARIIAIEPDSANFELLTRNLAHFDAAVPVKGALWSHSTRVAIKNPQKATWSYRVVESSSASAVPAYSVLDVMEQFHLPRIDVLKIDVEGAEIEALQDAKRWIHRVGMLIVEVHDRWRDGCSAAVEAAAAGENFIRRSASGGSVRILQRPRSDQHEQQVVAGADCIRQAGLIVTGS
jgi:FkbM family methyltransferase